MLNHEALPLISVVMPVYNGASTLGRALRSVASQTFRDWEVVAVDDGSNDGSADILRRWAAEDRRIRVFRLDNNRGVSAARNFAIQNVRGSLITYLDQDDEYYPDYLASVAHFRDKADVLVFGYDFVYENGPAGERPPSWEPGLVRQLLFAEAIVTPLGVAHRRELWKKAGGFNEAWCEEDSDLWRRMARTGAEFAFLPLKSGRYHVRADSASRMPHITRQQREMFLENWCKGRPIYEVGGGKSVVSDLGGNPHPSPLPEGDGTTHPHPNPLPEGEGTTRPHNDPRPEGEGTKRTRPAPRDGRTRKIAFVSPHCILDFTNGAAMATLDGLGLLARSGFECQAFCSSRMDAWEEVLVEEILAQRQIPYVVRNAQIGAFQGRMIFTTHGKVAVTLFRSASTRGGWIDGAEVAAFLTACEIFLTKNRPDVVWTYGGDPVSLAVQQLVKRLDIPILFGLHNFAYRDLQAFRTADYVIVPTEFCRQYYWDALGLASLRLPLVVDPERVGVEGKAEGGRGKGEGGGEDRCAASPHPNPLREGEGDFVTFVNPDPRKGMHFFARIAEVLFQRRPEIRLLLVEGASKASFLPKLGIDLGGAGNVRIMPNSPDARRFLRATKILLMPSLMENAGLVAMEAMTNGIPVLASNRGALPETIGDAGLLFDIPARYTPETRDLPTAEEVAPWVEAIIRLWDDAGEYEHWSRAARERARQWHPDRLAPIYREFFGSITHQPGPPLAPRGVANGLL